MNDIKIMQSKYVRPRIPALALRESEAAAAIGVCRRKFQEMMAQGLIPHKRVGGLVLFPVDVLTDWLRKDITEGKPHTKPAPKVNHG